jgi:signal transduction histidine kinase
MSTPSIQPAEDAPFPDDGYLDRLVASAPEPLVLLDGQGLVRQVNERLCRLLKRSATELRGRSLSELLPPREWEELRQQLEHGLRRPGEVSAGEIGMLGADAVPVTLHYTLLALPGAEDLALLWGRPLQEIVKLTRDLALLNAELSQSNRRLARSHDELAQERAHLRLLFDLSRTLSQSLDFEQVLGDVLRLTRQSFEAQAAGLLLLDAEGHPARWLAIPDTPEPAPEVLRAALHQGAEGRALRTRLVQRVDDSTTERPGLPGLLPGRALLVVPLLTEAGALGTLTLSHPAAGFFDSRQELVLFTAAETSALAIQNALHYTRLREAEMARERMTNLLVHDIRSPLMATNAGIEIVRRALQDQPIPPYIAESLESGLRSIRSVVELTDQMLEIKRLQAGSYPLDEQPLALSSLFEEASALLLPTIEANMLRLEWRVEPAQLGIFGDARLLLRVLINLLSNALRFTPSGGQIVLVARAASQGGVLVCIEDEGPGVPELDRERIFLPFAQGAGETQRGTGLGLAFCREVVEAHGGRIWVEAREQGGSRFCLSLPGS